MGEKGERESSVRDFGACPFRAMVRLPVAARSKPDWAKNDRRETGGAPGKNTSWSGKWDRRTRVRSETVLFHAGEEHSGSRREETDRSGALSLMFLRLCLELPATC
jgi:hypothetical protein